MVFVPEGQHDSSQARSAWVEMQRGPVPEGRLKALLVPQIVCRRNGAHEWFSQPRSAQSSRWDGAIFLTFQALRAWLLSCCPSGTKTLDRRGFPCRRSVLFVH